MTAIPTIAIDAVLSRQVFRRHAAGGAVVTHALERGRP